MNISVFCGNQVTGQILLCMCVYLEFFVFPYIILKKTVLKINENKDLIYFPFKFKDVMSFTTDPLVVHGLQFKNPW